jgi:hypothetical protein
MKTPITLTLLIALSGLTAALGESVVRPPVIAKKAKMEARALARLIDSIQINAEQKRGGRVVPSEKGSRP